MPNMKTRQNQSRGTSKCSRLCQKSKTDSKISPPKSAKISKYFVKVSKDVEVEDLELFSSTSSSSSVSPYKDCISAIKTGNLNISDSADFKPCEQFTKVSKIQSNLRKTSKRSTKRLKQIPLRQCVEGKFNMRNCDVNPEHLQMGIALSESSYQQENPKQSVSNHETIQNFKQALEKYGIKCGKNKLDIKEKENKTSQLELSKKAGKKSRYQYITPILHLRTSGEREALIASKVSLLLDQNNRYNHSNLNLQSATKTNLYAENLKEFHCNSSKIFALNNMDLNELNTDYRFSVENLHISPSERCCGKLLRNWHEIAGRDSLTKKSTCKSALSRDSGHFSENCNNLSQPHPDSILKTREDGIDSSAINDNLNINSTEKNVELHPYRTQNAAAVLSDLTTEDVQSINLNCDEKKSISPPNEAKYCRSISPDLFGSEDEYDSYRFTRESKQKQEIKIVDYCDLKDETMSCQAEINDLNISGIKALDLELCTSEKFDTTKCVCNQSEVDTTQLNVTDYVSQILTRKSGHKNSIDAYERMNMWNFEDADAEKIISTDKNSEELNKLDEKLSQESSQESILISDDELNYSCSYNKTSRSFNNYKNLYQNKYDLSDSEETETEEVSQECSKSSSSKTCQEEDDLPELLQNPAENLKNSLDDSFNDVLSSSVVLNQIEHQQDNCSKNTPSFKKTLLIKTENVTPMANYDSMDTPKIAKELDKYGVKPLKRRRGAKLLKYIYESTHPLVGPHAEDSNSDQDDEKVVKKRKIRNEERYNVSVDTEELIFEKTQSKKVASCRIPLQIVWHNFVISNPEIRENILLYEPLQLEVLHSMLKEQGYKFNIQDLLTFLDKKCITVRTCQKSHQNRRKKGKS